ncbi:PSD1 and planctomycete cytochrome C domain-containing protein [Algoriphagus sp. C2-6-M1]|nr:PSD1 and planctomycete cytochrome C domain-containing protein [Algoriphagus sp. C2-6-M1]MEB2782939.1 PSD1 and planctomycete cytochrome C domain-containing protein [Algoriphagus sp. C2-6-M1]
MIVHFPVALLVVAALMELFTLGKFHSRIRPGILILAAIGALSAIIAAPMGWLLATNEGTSGELLDLHQWIGIGTAALSLVTLFFLSKIRSSPIPSQIKAYRTTLFLTALCVSFAGHFGGSLTHGEDFLTEVLPGKENELEIEKIPINLAAYSSELTPDTEMKLIGEVRMVLAHNCYKCHSGSKIKGELRLDEKEFVFTGGENGKILIPGNPGESEIIRRINLRKNHDDVMPSKGNLLSKQERELIALWIAKGAPWPDGAAQQSVYRVAELAPRNPILPAYKAGLNNPIDLWVDKYFRENKLKWNAVVDDKTYLRRIYLDITGLIPSPQDLEEFRNDQRPDKRDIWLQDLLNQSDEYATHWLSFWNDALRNDYTGTGYITNGRFNITDWLYTSLRDNKPYDQFVKELLNPTEKSKGFIEGIRWRGTVNASQRTEMQAAQNVGQVILGLNLKCASCHDSFISDWKLEESYAFANIFADSTLEVSRCEVPTGKMAKTAILWEELGNIDSMATKAEKLRQLADRLVQPANGRMYRTIVNRVWKQLMGRGIVEPVDEMDNMPWSQDLLDWLASDFVENGYNLKELIYQIASSKIYQSQSVGYESYDAVMAEDYKFNGMVRKRMTAEQFSDAVSEIVYPLFPEEEIKYNPFELQNPEHIKPSFARASLVANNPFLTALGRPNREIVSTSREAQGSLLQALELTNGERLNTALQKGAEKWKSLLSDPVQITEELYQKALNRKPNENELAFATKALGQNPDAAKIQDLFWAVILLPEFQMVE